jgi:LacI family transcriptional regulator
MGGRAAELALRLLDHEPVDGLVLKFEAELVRRESVA